jgi:hypothetical protein
VARDLIPPPSPAGRPAPEHESSYEYEAEPEPEPAAEPTEASGPLPPSPFRARFGFITGALLGCGLAAIVALLVLLTSNSGDGIGEGLAPNWSAWHPDTTDSFTGAVEIARHVGGTYRNEKRKPLASVSGGPIAFNQFLLTVALADNGDKLDLVGGGGSGVQYVLEGTGKNGRLQDSKPSKARHRLLRREALELALYSFRYLPKVTMVVTLLPPAPKIEQVRPVPKGKKAAKASKAKAPAVQSQAIFYRPGDLESQLKVPLKLTMATTPPPIDKLDGEEARRIDSLTLSNLFEFKRGQGQDGRAYLVLKRPGS